uniref:Uncharacterized protein n=1 Tax=Arundo donax TaxID=35708 RepID=A0A0A9ETK0_ARUDO
MDTVLGCSDLPFLYC